MHHVNVLEVKLRVNSEWQHQWEHNRLELQVRESRIKVQEGDLTCMCVCMHVCMRVYVCTYVLEFRKRTKINRALCTCEVCHKTIGIDGLPSFKPFGVVLPLLSIGPPAFHSSTQNKMPVLPF